MTWTAAHEGPGRVLSRSTHATRADAGRWLLAAMAATEPAPEGVGRAMWLLGNSHPGAHFMWSAGGHTFALSSGDTGTLDLSIVPAQ